MGQTQDIGMQYKCPASCVISIDSKTCRLFSMKEKDLEDKRALITTQIFKLFLIEKSVTALNTVFWGLLASIDLLVSMYNLLKKLIFSLKNQEETTLWYESFFFCESSDA